MSQSKPVNLNPPESLLTPAVRMFDITGFVSILCPIDDARPRVFARYYHVRRVAWTSRFIAKLIPNNVAINLEYLDWLAWAHDLNRWPFAHNSERGHFDQAADFPRYIKALGLNVPAKWIKETQQIIDKKYDFLNAEGRIVLLADIVTGFIEDPIWLTTALNITPKVIPEQISKYLCIPLENQKFLQQVLGIANTFKPNVEPENFVQLFDEIFVEIVMKFIKKRNIAQISTLGDPEFEQNRYAIKEEFMRKVIFPYNNEKISRGARLKKELIEPLLIQLADKAPEYLTSITDEMLILEAIDRSIIFKNDIDQYRPQLDFMAQHEPANSFRTFMGM